MHSVSSRVRGLPTLERERSRLILALLSEVARPAKLEMRLHPSAKEIVRGGNKSTGCNSGNVRRARSRGQVELHERYQGIDHALYLGRHDVRGIRERIERGWICRTSPSGPSGGARAEQVDRLVRRRSTDVRFSASDTWKNRRLCDALSKFSRRLHHRERCRRRNLGLDTMNRSFDDGDGDYQGLFPTVVLGRWQDLLPRNIGLH